MKFTIIKPDGVVGVGGLFLKIDLSSLPANLHAVQWSGNKGHEEWADGFNTEFTDLTPYQPTLDLWDLTKAEIDAKLADRYHGLTQIESIELADSLRNGERAAEYTRRVGLANGTSDTIALGRANSKQLKALRKESKGAAPQKDIDYLDARDVLDDVLDLLDTKNDELELYIEDSIRTLQELKDLDVTADVHWV